jgi:hypothetical protein
VTTAPARPQALRVTPAALEQRVASLLQRQPDRQGRPSARVLVRAEPVWDGEPTFKVGDRAVHVAACVSPLAVLEQITRHAQAGDGSVLVVLTDRDAGELGNGVLSQVLGHQVLTLEPWSLVLESFGAQRLDPRLAFEPWAAEALVEALPPGGWPRLTGTVLSRDVALRHLAFRRLGLERLGIGPDDLDAHILVQWSALPGAVGSFGLLRAEERQGLSAWLGEVVGQAARVLFALIGAGHGEDALALGLVCAAVWSPGARGATERAQGRIDRYVGQARLKDEDVRVFARVAEEVVVALLAEPADSEAALDARTAQAALDRAEELLRQFAAEDAAQYSDLLRSGFEHRIGAVAANLHAWLRGGAVAAKSLADAVARLDQHRLRETYRERVERASMAQRLAQWLGAPVEPPASVGDGVSRQVAEWGWVDLALAHVWAGEDVNPELKAAYRALYGRVAEHRRSLDAAFAERLAVWTAAGSPPGRLLLVESVLERVVAPLVGAGKRPVLLLVLDGMSAAVAVELTEELRRQRWDEYDPLGGDDPEREPRRASVVAALPTTTTVSRASLLSGALREGGQDEERQAFESRRLWHGHAARLFHADGVRGPAGEVLGEDLSRALSDPRVLVAVVLNTIDDALDRGREGSRAGWRVADVGVLHALLDYARYHGRAVVITSDHGHVLERGGALRQAPDLRSARHRAGDGPVADGEVALAGSRVVAPGNRVVALWDPDARYASRRAGYHGGASLAEVTVPLLAFLPLGAAAPAGWRALADQHPAWWSALPRPSQPAPAERAPARRPRRPVLPGQAALELPEAPAPSAPPAGGGLLVDELLASEMFAAQHGLTPRRVPVEKIRAAVTALLDAGGVLAVTALADRAGEQPARAGGFVTTLQRIFNVDNYPVLSVIDDGRTARLDTRLLREQFGLRGSRR